MSRLSRLTFSTLIFATLAMGATVQAATYYVDATLPGNDSYNGISEATPFLTIQKAHDVAVAGDLILVKNGIYRTANTSQLVAISRSGTSGAPITFRSMNKHGAKLSGQSNSTAIAFNIGTASHLVIQDFDMYGFSGMAISTNTGSNLSILGNLIHDIGRFCTDTVYGRAGIFSRPTYTNLTITGNTFHTIGRYQPGENGCVPQSLTYQNQDHAVYLESNTVTIANNIFYNMKAGWAIHMYPEPLTGVNIINNVFAEPNTWRNGYILLYSPMTNVDIANNIFLSPTGSCSVLNGSGLTTTTNVTIRNNITLGGNAGCFTKAGVTFSENLNNTNPLLKNAGGRDYTLTDSSPAIDAGVTISNVTVDFSGIQRPQGSGYDIGAYEGTGQPNNLSPATPTGLTIF